MYLYFKDDGTLHMRSKVKDTDAEAQFSKKCQVPNDFNLNGDQVTDAEGIFSYKEKTYDQVVASQLYSDKRAIAYPSIEDQLDKIFHDGLEAWKAEIQAIKDANPKN
jgi:hypothetical protein